MEISVVLKLALQRVLKHRKRNSIVMIPLIIMTILTLFEITIQCSIQEYVKCIEDNIEMRELWITYTPDTYNEIIEKLSKIEHIDMIVDQYESFISATSTSEQFSNSETDGYIYEEPANNKTCPEVIQGRKITDNDSYVMVIPNKLYSDSNHRNFNESISEDEYIDGTSLIGTNIVMKIVGDNQTLYETFEVIGVYDSDRYLSDQKIYMPKSIIKEINKELNVEYTEFHMRIIVDKLQNIKEVQNSLIENNLLKNTKIQIDASNANNSVGIEEANFAQTTNISVETQKIIKNIMYILIIMSTLIFLIMLLVTNVNKLYRSSTEFGILKIEGYKNREIQKMTIIENLFICIISILIAVILFKITQLLGNFLIDYIILIDSPGLTFNKIQEQLLYIRNIPQKLDIKALVVFSIIISLFEILNTYFINKKILSKKICDMLKQ